MVGRRPRNNRHVLAMKQERVLTLLYLGSGRLAQSPAPANGGVVRYL
ncbi:hypothetical protein J2X53_002202 [Pseudorhodobacter sp. 4114]|nr:hypothetical protein [Pseudorhodobacter sp. 4114]